VILDACMPFDFRHHITNAKIVTARYVGVKDLKNGALLAAIEGKFDVFVIVDAGLVEQQSLSGSLRQFRLLWRFTLVMPDVDDHDRVALDPIEDRVWIPANWYSANTCPISEHSARSRKIRQ
jgi:hypothetical protein